MCDLPFRNTANLSENANTTHPSFVLVTDKTLYRRSTVFADSIELLDTVILHESLQNTLVLFVNVRDARDRQRDLVGRGVLLLLHGTSVFLRLNECGESASVIWTRASARSGFENVSRHEFINYALPESG